MKKLILYSLILLTVSSTIMAQKKQKKSSTATADKTMAAFTSSMKAYEGFFDFYYDEKTGKVYLEIDQLDKEILYVNSLTAGVGSNDIGLDRGQLGNRRVVRFEKHGPKILMIQPNYDYRAVSDNQEEVKSVKEAFASSVLWGFDVTKEENGKYLVDFTSFLLRDAHGVSQRLARTQQGSYKLDAKRSVVYLDATFNFPKNSEFETLLTFAGQPKGGWVQSVVPSPDAVSVRMHHSLIELPDAGYTPRKFDPRSGFIFIDYQDYATPIQSSLVKRYIVRHRLEKKDPNAEVSEAVEPIVYYLDRGTPEPVRSALLEGAQWWNEAFEAAGFKDAFQVKIMPEDAHPMDIRYNVIQWVHRSTRGWSYGASVVDPRTGEIIKGHVSLGSLRVRQDFLIAQGLLNQYDEGTEPMIELALARLRQLSAHEVGHTIGLVHSYASSTNDRASVMDYPHPLVKIDENGEVDLSDAYDTQIGEWDKVAIQYGYAEVEDESQLSSVLEEAFDNGLRYVTDRDARARDGAHPYGHLWDGGANPTSELNRMMKIRRKVLDQLSEESLPSGAPYSSLEEVLVPMYLFHRYQVEATSKLVGGIIYNYAVKGGNQEIQNWLPRDVQVEAMNALLNTLDPAELKLSEELLMKIPPKAHGYNRNRETFASKTGPPWDYYTAISTSTQLTLNFLFDVHRANRLVMYNQINPDQPGLEFLLQQVFDKVFSYRSNDPVDAGINRMIQDQVMDRLIMLASSKDAFTDTKNIVWMALNKYMNRPSGSISEISRANYQRHKRQIMLWREDPEEVSYSPGIKAPDGSPIGSDAQWYLDYDCQFDY